MKICTVSSAFWESGVEGRWFVCAWLWYILPWELLQILSNQEAVESSGELLAWGSGWWNAHSEHRRLGKKDVRWVFYLPSSLVLGLCLRLFKAGFRVVSSVRVSRDRAGLGVVALLLLLRVGELGREVAIS
jgi:hypothetical protein